MKNALLEEYRRLNRLDEAPMINAMKTPGDDREANRRMLEGILAGSISGELNMASGYAGALSGKPAIGALTLYTDWSGEPRCIVRTQALLNLRLDELGEREWQALGGDMSLDSWLEETRARIKAEAEELGIAFGDDTALTVELFERVYPVSANA